MKKYYGLWRAWCSTWVDENDTHSDCGRIHNACGYAVDRRSSNHPIVPEPPSAEVRAAHKAHAKMMSDFMQVAR